MNKDDVFFVKKIYELAKKMNRNIKISTKDDAANFYAYMKGFSSWAEMNFYEGKNNLNGYDYDEKIDKSDALPSFEEKTWVFNHDLIKTIEKDILVSKIREFEKKSNPLSFASIGTFTNLKSERQVSLINENALIYGNDNYNNFEFFQTNVLMLEKWKKNPMICGLNPSNENHKELINTLKKNNAIFIGENIKKKINPMIDLFAPDVFEDFFSEQNNEDNIFADIWINIIRIYQEQLGYKITPQFLKESLKIESLIQLMTGLEKNIQIQMKPLMNYINKYLEVVYLKEKQTFIMSVNTQEKHYKQVEKIEKRIDDLISLCKDGVFDLESDISIFDIYKEGRTIVILDCEKDYRDTYWSILFNLFNLVIKEQHEYLEKEMLASDNYRTYLLVWNSSEIINEGVMKIITKNNEYWKTHLYDLLPENNNPKIEKSRDIFLQKIRQVLFLRQNIQSLNRMLEERIKYSTSQWEVNLFYLNFNVLKVLEDNEAILWQFDTSENVLNGIEEYTLRKIKLNHLDNEE